MPKSKFDDFPVSTFEELESNFHLVLEYWRNDFDNKYGIGVDTKGSLDFDNNLADPASFTGTTSNTFTIDTDDTGGDVSLIFGKTNNEFLKWVDADSRFLLSDDLELTGDLLPTTDGTYDIGSTVLSWKDLYLTGSLYFDDTNKFTHDGVNFTLNDSLSIAGGITASDIINANGGITSDDLTDTAWGIQNQNLLDKTATESLSGLYTWTTGGIILNDNIPLEIGTAGTGALLTSDGFIMEMDLATGSIDYQIISTNQTMMFIDEGSDKIGFGTSTPSSFYAYDFYVNWLTQGTRTFGVRVQAELPTTANNASGLLLSTIVGSDNTANVSSIAGGTFQVVNSKLSGTVGTMTGGNFQLFYGVSGVGVDTTIGNALNVSINTTTAMTLDTDVAAINGVLFNTLAASSSDLIVPIWNWVKMENPDPSGFDAGVLTGLWIDNLTAGTTNYGIVLDGNGLGSQIQFGATNTGDISHDGTNMNINPDVVGSGRLLINNRDVKSMALMVR